MKTETLSASNSETAPQKSGFDMSGVGEFNKNAAEAAIKKRSLEISSETKENLTDNLNEDSLDENGYDSFSIDYSAPDGEHITGLKKQGCEQLLGDYKQLKTIGNDYLKQYDKKSKSLAMNLDKKEYLDYFIRDQFNGPDKDKFLQSKEFKNYAKYILVTAEHKKCTVNGQVYYPEFATNPALKDPTIRQAILDTKFSGEQATKAKQNVAHNILDYNYFIKDVEGKFDRHETVSQAELDVVGDYIYSGHNYENGTAKKFTSYILNEVNENSNLSATTSIVGALANYYSHNYTRDDRIRKNSRFIIANHTNGDPKRDPRIGVSTPNGYCVLEQDHFLEMKLGSDAGLEKSRTDTIVDPYSLMLVSFHEVTHDYQRLLAEDGSNSSGAMAHILNRVLSRRNPGCFEVTKDDGTVVKTNYYKANHDGDEVEIQADEEAWRQCRKFIHEHENTYQWSNPDQKAHEIASKHWSKCMENEREVRARRAFALKINEHGEEVPYIEFDIENLSDAIKQDNSLLQKQPRLAEYFNEQGEIKPSIFFAKKIGQVENDALDTFTDDFGVEFATYALNHNDTLNSLIDYAKNHYFTVEQVQNCAANLYNVIHQNALKTRAVRDADFSHYDETHTRGKDVDQDKLRAIYLTQYIKQLYNSVHITEILKQRFPDTGDYIDYEQKYYASYMTELSRDVTLDPAFVKTAKDRYQRSKHPQLQNIANGFKV